jgi:hypothetical protein
MKMGQGVSQKGICWNNSPTERVSSGIKLEQLGNENFSLKVLTKLMDLS